MYSPTRVEGFGVAHARESRRYNVTAQSRRTTRRARWLPVHRMALPPGRGSPRPFSCCSSPTGRSSFLDECARSTETLSPCAWRARENTVSLAAPELIKQVFQGDPEQLHAGAANVVLQPVLGPRSVLLLDGQRHARERKVLMPPLHGERMRAYAQLMAEATRAELDRMPVGREFSVHPYMQAITLEVIMRAVFGVEQGEAARPAARAPARISGAAARAVHVHSGEVPRLPPEPVPRVSRRKARVDAAVQELVDTRPRRRRHLARRRALAAALGAARRWAADDRRRAQRRAAHDAARRSRDHRHPRCRGRSAWCCHTPKCSRS